MLAEVALLTVIVALFEAIGEQVTVPPGAATTEASISYAIPGSLTRLVNRSVELSEHVTFGVGRPGTDARAYVWTNPDDAVVVVFCTQA